MDIGVWATFNVMIVLLLGIDLFANRHAHVISIKEASLWSIFWIGLALLFNVYIYYARGPTDALNFLTGYLIEKSLSIDNLFVFLLIFNYFHTPKHLLHKVLFWGVFGAIIMRAIFIALGVTIITKFHWIIYIFGLFLIYSGIKLWQEKEKKIDFDTNMVIKFFRRIFPVSKNYIGDQFIAKVNGKHVATPLMLTLIAIEFTDLIFAVDSIPAILAITYDPFIVYTSNIFAILGLRSLFFALSGMMGLFYYLHYGLAAVLILVGLKMLLADVYHFPIIYTLLGVLIILGTSIAISIMYPKKSKTP